MDELVFLSLFIIVTVTVIHKLSSSIYDNTITLSYYDKHQVVFEQCLHILETNYGLNYEGLPRCDSDKEIQKKCKRKSIFYYSACIT